MVEIRPIFLFSLPRSGSTLVQRVLASAKEIETHPEPWLLLPLFYMTKEVYAEYNHKTVNDAISAFIEQLPKKEFDIKTAIVEFATSLYAKATKSPNAKYFLDKTPRYSLISDDIIDAFEEGKFIFLWRNPLAVITSINHSWADGKWNAYRYYVDLYKGLLTNISAFKKNQDKVVSVRYEDLVIGSTESWQEIFDYLKTPFDKQYLTDFSAISFEGQKGDQIGTKKYKRLSSKSVNKWEKEFSNPLRKRWARNYLAKIGSKNLELIGYSYNDLLDTVNRTPFSFKYLFSDIIRMLIAGPYHYIDISPLRSKLKKKWKNDGFYQNR
ncbi:sulfotransferase family protein [Ekhidna sp.]|uniref:sulfotransferase family protein n=1 Tax=Ekhidna sp. TaxID=2608089 RepID=UPI003BABBF50